MYMCIYCIGGDFVKVFRFGKYGKDLQIKNSQYIDYYIRTYGAKNSDRQIFDFTNAYVILRADFFNFYAHQTFLVHGISCL